MNPKKEPLWSLWVVFRTFRGFALELWVLGLGSARLP